MRRTNLRVGLLEAERVGDRSRGGPLAFSAKYRLKLLVGLLVVVAVASGCADDGASIDDPQLAVSTQVVEQSTNDRDPAETTESVETPTAVAVPSPTSPPTPAVEVESESESEAAPEIAPVVFNDDFGTSIAPIFADKCASCHNAGGPGATHWQLETAADLVDTHQWISSVVGTQYMPPWPASDRSLVFHDDRSLGRDEIEAIVAWSASGAALDVDADTPIESPAGVIALDTDVEIAPHEPFQGSTAVADDYRCFIYDLNLTQQKWLQGFEFVPDQTQIVHHAIGYLAPGQTRQAAQALSDRDELGGWQCYGGSGISEGDELFLGWAPGQLPTQFPEGSGLVAEPGDYIILQIHYHFDTEAPPDASTIRLDWADTDDGAGLDPIETASYIGPAEIPCSDLESGPLCDRESAIRRAYVRYGVEGVQADFINRACGVRPEDFASMTNGIATSSCKLPVRDVGEIVSVFLHQHEIGSSIRMTLNAGRDDERVLLDIPEWSFDWQYNYYPVEQIELKRGDNILLECAWDRSLRSPDLEPAYVLWADGTNDEMCFATIATRVRSDRSGTDDSTADQAAFPEASINLPETLTTCMRDAGVPIDSLPDRDGIEAVVEQLFACAEPGEIGEILTSVIAENFGGLVNDDGLACLAIELNEPAAVRDLLIFSVPDATDDEKRPIGELVGDCVVLSSALEEYGFSIPETATACINEAGRDLLVQATIDGDLPEEQTVFAVLGPCLAGS